MLHAFIVLFSVIMELYTFIINQDIQFNYTSLSQMQSWLWMNTEIFGG